MAMAIEVLCPNGHKIICPEDRAGRSARCPRCSEPFRIPEALQNGQPHPADAMEMPADLADRDAPRSNGASADSPSDVKSPAAADGRLPSAPGSDMALAVSASAEDVDVANSAEVLADWSGLSDLRLMDSGIIAKGDQPAAAAPSVAPNAENKPPDQQPAAEAEPAADDMILFLCPNGHKLHGLRRLAGKVGQCPHCDVKFEIPYPFDTDGDEEVGRDGLDDTVTEDPLSDFVESGPGDAAGGPQPVFEERTPERPRENDNSSKRGLFEAVRATGSSIVGRITGRSGKRKAAQIEPAPAPVPVPTPVVGPVPPPPPPPPARTAHPLAELLTRLWSERDQGGVIELHLRGGALLAPDWFDARQSQGTHGLFASQAADGTVAMTIVPWDEVTRVVVRGVVGLPDGMFE
jgi:hypothetical protein